MDRKYSGETWVDWANENAKNSNHLSSLSSLFRPKVEEFINSLERAGARVNIKSTRRNRIRAYLFHWSWKIALGKCKANEAEEMEGVNIIWDHGEEEKNVKAALEMVKKFGLAVPPNSTVPPSLKSKHISGHAIDMSVFWSNTIVGYKKDGSCLLLEYKSNPNLNKNLIEMGESYGVKKNKKDAPHWSIDGY